MEWINLSISQLAEADYRRSSLQDRGVWLTLLGYCVQTENFGRIAGAQAWTDYDYQQVLGLPAAAIEGDHLLWHFEQGDLCVSGYPHAKQKEIAAKRKAARKGNRIRWHDPSHSVSQSDSQSESGKEGERKGNRKEKGKEKEKGKSEDRAARAQASKPASLVEVEAYAREVGMSSTEAVKFFDHFEANGWRQGGRTPLRDWQAAARNWSRRSAEFAPAPALAGGVGAKKFGGGRAAAEPFDSNKPHAHTGGLEVFEPAPASAVVEGVQ